MSAHEYIASITWTGNTGAGTTDYTGYGRNYTVAVVGKPPLPGSAAPAYRGDAVRHNPEDLFVAAIAACHMLAYLALAARAGVRITAYTDTAAGRLVTDRAGGGRFDAVVLRPQVRVTSAEMLDAATSLHEVAHQRCFIAASCSVPITVEPVMQCEPL